MLDKKQLTVRLPASIVDYLTTKAKNENRALNDVITDVTAEYIKWHQGQKLVEDIAIVREQIKNEYGIHPDSTDDIRQLRDGQR